MGATEGEEHEVKVVGDAVEEEVFEEDVVVVLLTVGDEEKMTVTLMRV